MAEFSDTNLVDFVKKCVAAEDLSSLTAIVNVTDGQLTLYAAIPADKINETMETYYKTHYGPPVYMIDISKNNKVVGDIAEFVWGRVREEEE